jgi:mannose-1-phosphate guanylyltransferase
MYTILLSGGSGKRLWPLSGSSRSKQYIRFLADERTGQPCSMAQRMWGQLGKAGMTENCVICASEPQTEVLRSQLGDVNIAVEPEGRDTFAAVALSCAYLKSRMCASNDDVVCVIPVDSYTDQSYFEMLKHMPEVLAASGAEIVLMGIKPDAPSNNYGYILPGRGEGGFLSVDGFVEKPDAAEAEKLIGQGALWNGGVFCLRIGTVMEKLTEQEIPCDYDGLCRAYSKLPRTSFDYAVVEKCGSLAAVTFDGTWKDIGTWSAVSKIMERNVLGDCVVDPSCRNVSVINETNTPVVALGVSGLIVIVSSDGILVMDSHSDFNLKQIVSSLPPRPAFEERSWGTITVLDFFREGGTSYLVRKLWVDADKGFSRQGEKSEGSVSALKGSGKITMGGEEHELLTGGCFPIPAGKPYSLIAGKSGLLLTLSQAGAEETFL